MNIELTDEQLRSLLGQMDFREKLAELKAIPHPTANLLDRKDILDRLKAVGGADGFAGYKQDLRHFGMFKDGRKWKMLESDFESFLIYLKT